MTPFSRYAALAAFAFAALCLSAPAQAVEADGGMMTDVIVTPSVPQKDYPQPAPPQEPAVEAIHPHLTATNKQEHVVILHGIGRTSSSMRHVARAFRDAGYEDNNIGYNSTRDVLGTIIEDVYRRIRHYSDKDDEVVNFVCYSLGCLVTRGIIEQHRPKHLGRVVMMGPPNQGSEMADYLKDHAVSNWIFGPSLPQLGTANRTKLGELIGTDADYELGIIAGTSTIDPIASAILPDPNDGRVPVERTKLPGMKEHILMPVSHTTLITNDEAIAQALVFIQTGHFTYDPKH